MPTYNELSQEFDELQEDMTSLCLKSKALK